MGKARYWNVWWTLTMLSAALTILAAALEALGVLKDLGIFLSVAGVILTMVFGVTASTRSSLTQFRGDILPRVDRMDQRLTQMTERLDRIVTILDERLPRPAA